MKILQVIPYFYPAWVYGGPVRVAYELSKRLVENGHDVTVYTTDVKHINSRLDINGVKNVEGIKVHYFRNISTSIAKNTKLFITPSMISAMKKEIQSFDIIHLHEFRTFQNIIVHYFAKKYNIPYILQPRGSVPTMSKIKQKKLFDVVFGRSIVKDASKIIASSKIESDQYRAVFPDLEGEKIVHIPNGIDLETYRNLPPKGEFKKNHLINSDEKIILFLSRIHKRKGADILVEAFSKLKNEIENVKLVIAGPDEGYLDKLKLIVSKLNIEGDVMFPGPLYEKDKLEAYIDADVFILPSKDRYESFGNVVLEACACGTPVIITNNCGVSEWIGNNVGYVVEYDKDQLRDAMIKVLSDERLRRRFGEEGRKLVKEEFGWDKIVKKMEELYYNLNFESF